MYRGGEQTRDRSVQETGTDNRQAMYRRGEQTGDGPCTGEGQTRDRSRIGEGSRQETGHVQKRGADKRQVMYRRGEQTRDRS
jgi:hypothetical protein